MKINLYNISDEYIKYLRQFDDKVYDNKENKRSHHRKYIGAVLTINNFNYYIPMSSPKKSDYSDNEQKKVRKSVIPIIRMTDILKPNYLYGTLRVSNMIPVPITELTPYYIKDELDKNYANVILGEISFITRNRKLIINSAQTLYKQVKLNKDIPYVKNCCNFKLLEQKCKEYNKQVLKEIEDDETSSDASGSFTGIILEKNEKVNETTFIINSVNAGKQEIIINNSDLITEFNNCNAGDSITVNCKVVNNQNILVDVCFIATKDEIQQMAASIEQDQANGDIDI